MRSQKAASVSFALVFAFAAPFANAQQSSFIPLQFGPEITLEAPRSWTYLTERISEQLNTNTEAALRLAGADMRQGNNQVLLAANAYTGHSKPSATLRLSVRPGETPTQAQTIELMHLPRSEQSKAFAPAIAETRRLLVTIDGVRGVKEVDARVVRSKHLTCVFMEFEIEVEYGPQLAQTYLCPLGNKSVKLTTSYRKAEASMFKSTLQHVWSSLKAK